MTHETRNPSTRSFHSRKEQEEFDTKTGRYCSMCGGEGVIVDDPEGEGRLCPRCHFNQ